MLDSGKDSGFCLSLKSHREVPSISPEVDAGLGRCIFFNVKEFINNFFSVFNMNMCCTLSHSFSAHWRCSYDFFS